MKKIKAYMKSGNVIEFKCKDLTMKVDLLGRIREINCDSEESESRLFHLNVDEIEGITVNDMQGE